jgi:hypothetical protein
VKVKKKIWLVAGIVLFTGYFLCSARPIPQETVLVPRWLVSLESGNPILLGDSPVRETGDGHWDTDSLIPFTLGSSFGYFDRDGRFSVNQQMKNNVSLSAQRWAEYNAEPAEITVNDSDGGAIAVIENPRGYPFFLDDRTFLINSEQNAVSGIDDSGSLIWTYEFAGQLTCIDAAAGLVLTGSLDGVVGVLDSNGRQVFSFEPGGSRYSVILGCAISRDGSRLAIISGIDDQRFLLLERFGSSGYDYQVIYHEFLDSDFRRSVYISFIEEDRWIVFEQSGGLGLFEFGSRQSRKVQIAGDLSASDQTGGQEMVFAVVTHSGNTKKLVGVRLPGKVIIEAPFKSEEVFLGRLESRLFVGGRQALISFDVEKR